MIKSKENCKPRLVVAIALLMAALTLSAQAQTFTVLHNFTGGGDGAVPRAGLAMDAAGNLYGTATDTAFKLAHKGSGWVFGPLYTFHGSPDGASLYAAVAIGPNGSLYGPTMEGGTGDCIDHQGSDGCGTVFSLRPSPRPPITALSPWTETVLYRFSGGSDGSYPRSNLIFDQAGNLYGTTWQGGLYGRGVVFQLAPANGGWTENVLHTFSPQGGDGAQPYGGMIFDQSGNLYSTTAAGGAHGYGTVFELTPSGQGWSEHILYNFQGGSDGDVPAAGLIFDGSGNLYGTTSGSYTGTSTVFELSPSSGGWTFHLLYTFPGVTTCGPSAALVMDQAGRLYGTSVCGGASGFGIAFRLTPSGGGWTYTSLHDFTNGADGSNPFGSVVLDKNGNIYGTAGSGGAYGFGTVWEITP